MAQHRRVELFLASFSLALITMLSDIRVSWLLGLVLILYFLNHQLKLGGPHLYKMW